MYTGGIPVYFVFFRKAVYLCVCVCVCVTLNNMAHDMVDISPAGPCWCKMPFYNFWVALGWPSYTELGDDRQGSVEHTREMAITRACEQTDDFYTFLKGYMMAHAEGGHLSVAWLLNDLLRTPNWRMRCDSHTITIMALNRMKQDGYQVHAQRTQTKEGGLTWRYRICVHTAMPCTCTRSEKQRAVLEFGVERADLVQHSFDAPTPDDEPTATTEKDHAMTLL